MWPILFFVLQLCKCDAVPIISTESGILQGKIWTSFKGREFVGFTGIPYAKPPIGELRFKAPEPAVPWEGVFKASKSHQVCLQVNIYDKNLPIIGEEDCLYLNVYTPTFSQNYNKPLPVMFYIHGGSFEVGSAKPEWLGPNYLLDKDIVLVVANYRLGALGFLSTSDDVVPGNNGLKDQTFALKWVKRNIAKFGGDPKKVTIFGNSAGAISVHLHMMSPLSKGLFHKVIAQSGPTLLFFIGNYSERSKQNTERLGKSLNCSTTSSSELIACLRNISARDIMEKQRTFISWDGDSTMPFMPRVESPNDEAFLSKHPIEIIESGEMAHVPVIFGIVSQEAAYKASFIYGNPELLNTLNEKFDAIIPPTFQIQSDEYNSSKKIRSYYFGDSDITDKDKLKLARMYSDGTFLFSHSLTLALHSQYTNQTIYQYLFDYRGSESYSSLFGDPNFDYGVTHTDELLYLYKLGQRFPNYAPKALDIEMTNILIELWTNFAISGYPTLQSTNFAKWTPSDKNGLGYYHIRSYNETSMINDGIFVDRAKFWRNLPIIHIELNYTRVGSSGGEFLTQKIIVADICMLFAIALIVIRNI